MTIFFLAPVELPVLPWALLEKLPILPCFPIIVRSDDVLFDASTQSSLSLSLTKLFPIDVRNRYNVPRYTTLRRATVTNTNPQIQS